MADICGNTDCKSADTEAELDLYVCLTCGTKTDYDGNVVEEGA